MRWKDRLAGALSERAYNTLLYYYIHLKTGQRPGRLNVDNPRTFNEKTIWLKEFHRYPNAHILADKVKVKDLVAERIGAQSLIPTLGVYDRAADVDFDALPRGFVLKANHGSGMNIVCPDKTALDIPRTRERMDRWLRTSYYDIGKEYQYRDIPRKLIAETLLANSAADPLVDYKVFCFSGVPRYVQVDLDRFTNHTRNFYDTSWNYVPFTTLYPLGTRRLPRPALLPEMLDIARVLSAGLAFARIDLYNHAGKVWFGEITLHHGGGFEPFMPREYDRILGDLLVLPSA